MYCRYFPRAPARAGARGARAAAVERGRRRPRRPLQAARVERHERAAAQRCRTTISACRPSCTAPTTSSAPTSRGRCRSAGRRCSTRGARSRGCAAQGYDRIGILGTSLGSCLSLLTTAHEPLIRAQALNHISPYFADVVWRGLSTGTCARGSTATSSSICCATLWKPISPRWYLERLRDRQTLLVYARYDLTFPVDLSEDLVREFRERGIPHEVAVLRCGHYSTGKAPFKFVDGWILTRFLTRALGKCHEDAKARSSEVRISSCVGLRGYWLRASTGT